MIPITITIADRSYRIRVDPHDEEMVRKTMKFLNDKILEFKTGFPGMDMQDYVSMVLAWYATQSQASLVQNITDDEVQDELGRMESYLDKILTNGK